MSGTDKVDEARVRLCTNAWVKMTQLGNVLTPTQNSRGCDRA
jgi:hypothetical protein